MTPRLTQRLVIDGPAGDLEVVVNTPEVAAPRGIALIAHPHPQQGGTLDNKVAQTLAKTFFGLGYVSTRFNFRGVGRSQGSFDDGDGETDDARAALHYAQQRFGRPGPLPVVLAGFSFGTFVQTRLAGEIAAERLVLVAPAVQRFSATALAPDTIVVHGEEDDVVPLADVLAWARPQALPVTVFPGCGHFFHGRLPQLQSVIGGMWNGRAQRIPGA